MPTRSISIKTWAMSFARNILRMRMKPTRSAWKSGCEGSGGAAFQADDAPPDGIEAEIMPSGIPVPAVMLHAFSTARRRIPAVNAQVTDSADLRPVVLPFCSSASAKEDACKDSASRISLHPGGYQSSLLFFPPNSSPLIPAYVAFSDSLSVPKPLLKISSMDL